MSARSEVPLAQHTDDDFGDDHLSSTFTSKPSPLRTRLYELYDANRGLLLIGFSRLTQSLMLTIVKLMSNQQDGTLTQRKLVPTVQLIALRHIITLVISEVWMHRTSVPHPFFGPPSVRLWLHLRGISGFFALFGAYYSIQFISMSDSTTIRFLIPFVTAFLGMVILKEAYSLKEAGAALVSFSGVLIIARPAFLFGSLSGDSPSGNPSTIPPGSQAISDHVRLIAVCVALSGVLGAALAFVSLRRIAKEAHTMHSMVFFSAWCLLGSIAGTMFYGIPWVIPSPMWMVGLLGICVLGFIGQYVATMGFAKEKAGRGAQAFFISIVFSLMSDAIVFHHIPSLLSVVGIVIIISSAIYVAASKQVEPRPTPPREADEEEEVGLMPLSREDDDGEEGKTEDSEQLRGKEDPTIDKYRS